MQTPEALPCRSCSGQHRLQKLGSGGERKDLGPTAEEWECTVQWFGKKKKRLLLTFTDQCPANASLSSGTPQVCF